MNGTIRPSPLDGAEVLTGRSAGAEPVFDPATAGRLESSPALRPAETEPARAWLTAEDLLAFHQGTHDRLYEKLGAHLRKWHRQAGVLFAVWAPDAERVQVLGDFNAWDKTAHALQPVGPSGLWAGFVPGLGQGTRYKYHLVSRYHGYSMDKADPMAFSSETPPGTASVVWRLNYAWGDEAWMRQRRRRHRPEAPLSIYEVHLGSWMRVPEEGNRWLTYRELAPRLASYVKWMGFTHVELLPIMEHPFYGSWGYQTTGYFAPTSRYGTPQDFMFFVDYLHHQEIGVILDWVPSHFPADGHGLVFFDGTHLYEHADPRKGFHPDWKSAIFNYGRPEVCSFLLSSALFWLDQYHIDGLRVDAVASMLYLDYSRRPGEWLPNAQGGRENLEAIAFLRRLNELVQSRRPDVLMIAEESTAWPRVSRPATEGGLGFGLKWDMGWMHDTLRYFKRNSVHRKHHQGELPFRMVYASHENFILPLSHDEVVHGKGSLFGQMAGDPWQKYANLRLLFGYMYALPGKKLLFMGGELAQWPEWSHESSIEWHVQNDPPHAGVQRWVRDLNHVLRRERALREGDFNPDGFEWVDFNDANQSVLSFLRKSRSTSELVLAVFNFTPVLRRLYRVGVPRGGFWTEILNSDARDYEGSGQGNAGGVQTEPVPWHHRPCSLQLTLPPLAALFFVCRP